MHKFLTVILFLSVLEVKASFNKFSTDGCSKSPNGILFENDILHCCILHDKKYFMGGSWQERKNADLNLKSCIENEGYYLSAKLYYKAVRIMGEAATGLSFQWGYGHKNIFYYRNLSSKEKKDAMRKINNFDCINQVTQV